MRQKLAKVNFVESKLADDKMIFFLDLSSKFLDTDGKLPKENFPDGLHPNVKGYEIWATAMEPKIAEMMGEKK
jgi:beta-glucosidase